ncbi:MAG: sulfite oxidase-like oxidoreductase [Deltaproteobacteria bacterium]|nr:sulfite oxidase-like oxidoreductase [Deltaproteobacteria bacterium]
MDDSDTKTKGLLRLMEHRRTHPKTQPPDEERSRLPPGQRLAQGFPVLDLGIHPVFDPKTWRLKAGGLAARPLEWNWDEFAALPKTVLAADFHCVTGWSKFDVAWGGVLFSHIAALVEPLPVAAHVVQESADGYTTNVPLKDMLGPDVLLAYELDGKPLPLEHGGPVRMVVPRLYAWKSAKFLTGLRFVEHDDPGYWERRGYHNEGDPWKSQRYRGD